MERLVREDSAHSNVSDWKVGSQWEDQRTDGSSIADVIGTIFESMPNQRLVMTFDGPGYESPAGPSKVTFEIQPVGVTYSSAGRLHGGASADP